MSRLFARKITKKSLLLIILLAIIAVIYFGAAVGIYGRKNLPLVEIWLGQPLALIKGYDWPRYREDGRLFNVAWIDKPIQLKLHLPNGQEITIASKGTWIGVETVKRSSYSYVYSESHDPINHVSILPLLELAHPDELARRLDEIGVNLGLSEDPAFNSERDRLETQARLTETCAESGFFKELDNSATVSIRTQTYDRTFGDGCYFVIDFWWSVE